MNLVDNKCSLTLDWGFVYVKKHGTFATELI